MYDLATEGPSARELKRTIILRYANLPGSLIMPDPTFTLVAAARADQTTNILRHAAGTTDGHVVGIETAV